ncbi:MAG: response regulator transcription factor, partial [Bacteroidota bacterium]
LLDLDMPVLNGLKTLKILKEKYLNLKVIILTMYESDQFILNAIQAGAHTYVLKDDEPQELENAIRGVMNDNYYATDRITRALMSVYSQNQNPKKSKTILLSEREMEVLKYTCQGFSSGEIGEKLFIAKRTVEGHQSKLLQKLNAKNKAALIISAIKEGLIDINEC